MSVVIAKVNYPKRSNLTIQGCEVAMGKHKVGTVSEFSEGSKKTITVGDKLILVAMSDGKLYAVQGKCSHMGMPLSRGPVQDKTVRCAMHGAVFDLETGKVLRNTQARDLETYKVLQEGDEVFIEL